MWNSYQTLMVSLFRLSASTETNLYGRLHASTADDDDDDDLQSKEQNRRDKSIEWVKVEV